jgi:glutamine cyclotransferase
MSFIAKIEPKADLNEFVLNGITYVENTYSDFYITGKNWNNIYLVKLD